jgi:hypothetical protein
VPQPDPLQDSGGGRVRRVELSDDADHPDPVDEVGQHRAGRLGGISVPPVLTRQGEADLGDLAGGIEVEGDVADDLPVVLDRQLRPAPGDDIGAVRLVVEVSVRVVVRVGQIPQLVASHVGVVAVGGERGDVVRTHHPHDEPVGRQRVCRVTPLGHRIRWGYRGDRTCCSRTHS